MKPSIKKSYWSSPLLHQEVTWGEQVLFLAELTPYTSLLWPSWVTVGDTI